MKRITLKTKNKEKSFGARAFKAIAIIQTLAYSVKGVGLTVADLEKELNKRGILYPGKNEQAGISILLQELIDLGAVSHPIIEGGSRRYVCSEFPSVIWN
jgi:hypothetical protein